MTTTVWLSTRLRIKNWIQNELENSLVLYYTGTSRDSAKIIDEQKKSTTGGGKSLEGMHELKVQAQRMKEAILKGDFDGFAACLRDGWEAKKKTSSVISNPHIEKMYQYVLEHGGKAAKISGAGGGGFMMIVCDRPSDSALWRPCGKRRAKSCWRVSRKKAAVPGHFTNEGDVMKQSSMNRLKELEQRYPALHVCMPDVEKAARLLIGCYENKGKVLVGGNGGSAADSLHIVGELMKGFVLPRRLGHDMQEKLRSAWPGYGAVLHRKSSDGACLRSVWSARRALRRRMRTIRRRTWRLPSRCSATENRATCSGESPRRAIPPMFCMRPEWRGRWE